IVGAILLAAAGWYSASDLHPPLALPAWLPIEFVGAGLGLVAGFVVAPYVSTRPARVVVDQARRLHVKDLVAATPDLVIGLVLSPLMPIPLWDLPGILGRVLPFAVCLFLMYLGITIVVGRRDDIFGLLGLFPTIEREPVETMRPKPTGALLDTSAII